MLKRIAVTMPFVILFIAIISFARGYRLDVTNRLVTATGLISVTSVPRSARVFLDGELQGVSDLTFNVSPGTYTISVVKDGYFPWTKQVTVTKEIVQSLDAIIYPINSSLTPLTTIGVAKAVAIGSTGEKILLFSPAKNEDADALTSITDTPTQDEANSVEPKSGLFVFDSTNRGVSFFPQLTLIADEKIFPAETDFTQFGVVFSPDYSQAILLYEPIYPPSISNENLEFYPEYARPTEFAQAFLISLDQPNTELLDISSSVDSLLDAWTQVKSRNLSKVLSSFEIPLSTFFSSTTKILDISSDKTKVLYEATQSGSLKQVITPPLIGANQTADERTVRVKQVYMYDLKEDKNYLLGDHKKIYYPIIHPNSRNIIYNFDKQISISDYDGLNRQAVYSGPYEEGLVGVSSDGRLLILSNLNPQLNSLPDLYAVGVR